jgi:hypothetical protein
MPEYLFKDTKTKKTFTANMTISERTKYLEENPHIEQLVHGAPMIGYSTVTRKIDDGFADVLRERKRQHRRSTINIPK